MDSVEPLCTYKSAGGVVVWAADELVLVLVRAGRLGPDGRTEVRLPKGHIEHGESRKEAAIREVQEESGIAQLEILSDLGHQEVEFTWKGTRYVRNETYFLMTFPSDAKHDRPEAQFERQWLSWDDALTQLTFEAEKEWLRRARIAWDSWLKNVSDQDPKQPDDHT